MRSMLLGQGCARPAIAAVLAAAALAAAGCAKSETALARGRDTTAKAVTTDVVRQETVKRSVDLVGTLAAVDEVTISSEADGKVSRLLADLGDRVKAGSALIQLDNEKQQYNYDQMKAALARALAQYGAPDPQHLPEIEKTPDVQKANADLVQARQGFDRADQLLKRKLVPQQGLDDADAAYQSKKASYDSALQNAKNLRASIQAAEANMKL